MAAARVRPRMRGPSGSPTGTEDSLRAALATYDSAWLVKDRPTVERILSPEYTYFTSIGGLNDKAATLAFLVRHGLRPHAVAPH